jgi:hypothetical protein
MCIIDDLKFPACIPPYFSRSASQEFGRIRLKEASDGFGRVAPCVLVLVEQIQSITQSATLFNCFACIARGMVSAGVGYLGTLVSAVGWGSNYLPVKKYGALTGSDPIVSETLLFWYDNFFR